MSNPLTKFLVLGAKSAPKAKRRKVDRLDGKLIEKCSDGKFSFGYQSKIVETFFTQDEGSFILKDKKGIEHPAEQYTCGIRKENGTVCGAEVKVKTKTGKGNVFKHLLHNHFDGTEDAVVKGYNDALEEANHKGGPLTDYLKCDTITPKEDAIADWIDHHGECAFEYY